VSTPTWTPKTKTPRLKGWYVTRTDDGFIDWRAWGNGAWWKQTKGGWFEWFDGNGEPLRYDFLAHTRSDIELNRDQLPEPTAPDAQKDQP